MPIVFVISCDMTVLKGADWLLGRPQACSKGGVGKEQKENIISRSFCKWWVVADHAAEGTAL